jgi:hypothetical protein
MLLFSWLVDTAISEEHLVSIFSVEPSRIYEWVMENRILTNKRDAKEGKGPWAS